MINFKDGILSEEEKELFLKKAKEHNMKVKIEKCHKVRSTSPGMWQMAFDCRVKY